MPLALTRHVFPPKSLPSLLIPSQALRPLGVTVLGVPSDEHGPRPDALRALLAGARPPIHPHTLAHISAMRLRY